MEPLEVILFIIVFSAILFLTYVSTRYLAARAGKALNGRHLSIIESISLGVDKRLYIVKAGDKYILIASTAKSIEFLTEVNIDKTAESSENSGRTNQNALDFKSLLDKYVSGYKIKKDSDTKPSEYTAGNSGLEKFRVNLEKLKNITQKRNTHIENNGDEVTDEK